MFAGRPSLARLRLWDDKATFVDPITTATGRGQYAAQWYGLKAAFSQIERLHHEVTSGGNPITMDLRTRYVVKGTEKIIESKVDIFHDKDTGLITKVADNWNGDIKDGTLKDVSIDQFLNPWWWLHYYEGWLFWAWSFTWETRVWQVRAAVTDAMRLSTAFDVHLLIFAYSFSAT